MLKEYEWNGGTWQFDPKSAPKDAKEVKAKPSDSDAKKKAEAEAAEKATAEAAAKAEAEAAEKAAADKSKTAANKAKAAETKA